jgi:hypothetical protein
VETILAGFALELVTGYRLVKLIVNKVDLTL